MGQDGLAGGVNVSGSQGIVVGTGNTQINVNRSPNHRSLAGLSLHSAVTRIRQWPHDDAVDFFANTSSEELAVRLRALLLADEPKAVAILADLDPPKAAELIIPCEDGFDWLHDLPEATEAIAQRAVDLKWDHESGQGRLERAPQSLEGTDGYFRQYKQGCIYWGSHRDLCCAIRGPIAAFYLAHGGTGGGLGFPEGDESVGGPPGSGTVGMMQEFEGGCVFSSSHGTYRVSLEFADLLDSDSNFDWLGFPVAAAKTNDDRDRRHFAYDIESQRFQGGMIYSSEAGTFAVRSEVAKRVFTGWVPISAEEVIPPYPTARVQRFRGDPSMESAVYSSDQTGVHRVPGRTLALYEALGGPVSWLGLPTSEKGSQGTWYQDFEHGTIYVGVRYEPAAIPAETFKLFGNRLGYPMSQEEAVGDIGDRTIQYFEKGIVTLRNGKREFWPRPDERRGIGRFIGR